MDQSIEGAGETPRHVHYISSPGSGWAKWSACSEGCSPPLCRPHILLSMSSERPRSAKATQRVSSPAGTELLAAKVYLRMILRHP